MYLFKFKFNKRKKKAKRKIKRKNSKNLKKEKKKKKREWGGRAHHRPTATAKPLPSVPLLIVTFIGNISFRCFS